MAARILFVGDIHLGRRPSRLPDDLSEHGVEAADLTPAAAWRATVEHALGADVAAVVLAGDVVEGVDDRFEAFPHLYAGVEKLVDRGVPVLGVAGNHDVEALPRLAKLIPKFRLLGRGGRWERATLAPGVELLGWSFPDARVTENPLATLPAARPANGIATLGVLHCHVDGGRSPYAPVPRSQLLEAPVDAWLLGHVHRPDALTGPRPVGYLGSLVGLDPGEPGRHGPWLVEVAGPADVRARQLPLAPLRWEREDVPLADVRGEDPRALEDAFFGALRGALQRVCERVGGESRALQVVGCRLRLVGRTPHHRALRKLICDPASHPPLPSEGVHYFVEKVLDEAAPDLDLAALARGHDPVALCAQRLLVLRDGGEAAKPLLRGAAARLRDAASDGRWRELDEISSDPEALRQRLLLAGTRALEELRESRTEGGR